APKAAPIPNGTNFDTHIQRTRLLMFLMNIFSNRPLSPVSDGVEKRVSALAVGKPLPLPTSWTKVSTNAEPWEPLRIIKTTAMRRSFVERSTPWLCAEAKKYHAAASIKTSDSAPMAAAPVTRPTPGIAEAAPAPAPVPWTTRMKCLSRVSWISSAEAPGLRLRTESTYLATVDDCTATAFCSPDMIMEPNLSSLLSNSW